MTKNELRAMISISYVRINDLYFEKTGDYLPEEIRKELAEEQVQPELPGMNLQQPTRES